MAVKKLLDENSLLAIKDYIDNYGGKIDDVRINGTSIVTSKIANIAVEGTYNASTNKIATMSQVTPKLDKVTTTGLYQKAYIINEDGTQGTKSISSDGFPGNIVKYNANGNVYSDTPITDHEVANKKYVDDGLDAKVPTSRTIAGLALTGNISSSDLVTALGLSQALTFVGLSSTDPTSTSGATVPGHTTWKKGDVVLYNNLEYVNITGSNTSSTTPNPNWEELGDGASYALKTTTITATGALSGGGTLEANRTIEHRTRSSISTDSSITKTDLGFVKLSSVDTYGHVISVTNVVLSDLTGLGAAADSAVVHNTGDEPISGDKTFNGGAYFQDKFAIETQEDIVIASDSSIFISTDLHNNYGLVVPNTGSWLANRTIATTDDLTGFVTGPSSAVNGNIALFDGTTGKLIKDGGTSLATVTSHISDSNIHVTSANKTTWNEKLKDVKVTEVTSSTTGAGYQKLQKSVDGSTYTDVVTCLSYNEAYAILTGN